MENLVNDPFHIFRKPDCPRLLHTRWGDVDISVPTDGSWNQFDNPHQAGRKKYGYGPGFVPDAPPLYHPADLPDDDNVHLISPQSTSSSSSSRRNSFSIKTLHPKRLSIRLAHQRPKQQSEKLPNIQDGYHDDFGRHPSSQEQQQKEDGRNPTFNYYTYKPIQYDYPGEVAGCVPQQFRNQHPPADQPQEPRFRYIPAGKRYLEEFSATTTTTSSVSRSQSVSSVRSCATEPPMDYLSVHENENENSLENRRREIIPPRSSSLRPGSRTKGTSHHIHTLGDRDHHDGGEPPHHNKAGDDDRSRTSRRSSGGGGPRRPSASASSSSSSSTTSRSGRRISSFFSPGSAAAPDHTVEKKAARRKSSLTTSRTMTMVMVPDSEDMYG